MILVFAEDLDEAKRFVTHHGLNPGLCAYIEGPDMVKAGTDVIYAPGSYKHPRAEEIASALLERAL